MQPMPAEDFFLEPAMAGAESPRSDRARDARLRMTFDQHFEYVWRLVRRLGVPEASADDATQQVSFAILLAREDPCRRLHRLKPTRLSWEPLAAPIADQRRGIAPERGSGPTRTPPPLSLLEQPA